MQSKVIRKGLADSDCQPFSFALSSRSVAGASEAAARSVEIDTSPATKGSTSYRCKTICAMRSPCIDLQRLMTWCCARSRATRRESPSRPYPAHSECLVLS